MFGIGLEVHTLQFSWTFVPRKFHGLFETKKLGWFKLCIPTEGILYLWYQACYALVKVQRADLMCDVIKKLAPFVLSKLWILVADWSMHWSRDTFLIKLWLYYHWNEICAGVIVLSKVKLKNWKTFHYCPGCPNSPKIESCTTKSLLM